MPFWAIQCTNDENVKKGTDCGCNGTIVVKSLISAKATIHLIDSTSSIKYYELYLDSIESNQNYSSTLSQCNFLFFSNVRFKDGKKMLITGEIKSICSDPKIKIGSNAVILTKIEAVK